MKRIFNFLFVAIFVVVIVFQGCDDTINQTDIDNIIIPDNNVSYKEYIQPVFEAKCNATGCHNSIDRAANLSFATWADATSDLLVVSPGEPNSSKMVWSIEGRAGVEPMPPIGYPLLTKNQINGIKTWIAESAKNN